MAAAVTGGGSAAAAASNTEPILFGDQSLLDGLYSIYSSIGHDPRGNAGTYTLKSGRALKYKGRPYYIIEKGTPTFDMLKEEFELTKYASDPEYESAPYVGKLVAAKLNQIPRTSRAELHKYSGIFVFDLEDCQAIDLRRYLTSGIKIDVSNIQIYNELHTAMTALHNIGVIHRDLKPENVVILYKMFDSDGKLIHSSAGYPYVGLRIIDFGLAAEGHTSVYPAGTKIYMPDPYPVVATPNLNKYALKVIAERNLMIPRSMWKTRKTRKGHSGRKGRRFTRSRV